MRLRPIRISYTLDNTIHLRRKILRLYRKPYGVATVLRPHPIAVGLPRPSVNAVNIGMEYHHRQAETIIPLSVRNRTSGK